MGRPSSYRVGTPEANPAWTAQPFRLVIPGALLVTMVQQFPG